jgi:hypothetical protein
MSMRIAVLVSLAFAGLSQAQNVSRTKRGDTAVVVTTGNGKWGAPHDAIEVLRVPGDTKETTFGAAFIIEATPDGGVVVVDTKGEEGIIVRQFDANGKFLRNLGRQGPGPGEYLRNNLTVAPGPKGTVYIRDSEKSVSIFGPDGKLVNSFALFHNNGSTNEIVAMPDGSAYLRAPFERTASALAATMQRPMLHYDRSGKLLDSISVTTRWLPEGAPGNQWWRIRPDGRLLFTRTDKVGFMIVDRNGKNPRIGEIAAAPVPYLSDERQELQAARDLFRDKCDGGRGGRTPERVIVPETKLPARGATLDVDGRIWIAKSTTAQKIPPKVISSCSSRDRGSFKQEATYEEPPVFAGFLPDGTYLGEVRFPLRARVTFVGNTAWALVPDADDVQTLVKYRLY